MSATGGQPATFAGMADFLAASKTATQQILAPGEPSDTRKLLLCLGNEAADIDSIVSALVLAVACQHGALDHAIPGLSREYVAVPVLGIPAEDFALRQDAVYLLDQLSLSGDMLVYLPSLETEQLARLQSDARLALALTDHNKLTRGLAHMAPAVVAVVDHHEDTSVFSSVPYYKVMQQRGGFQCICVRAGPCSQSGSGCVRNDAWTLAGDSKGANSWIGSCRC